MLLRVLALGTVLVGIQSVSAEDTPASGDPAIQQTGYGRPALESSDSLDDSPSGLVSDRLPTDAKREEDQRLLQQKSAELDQLQREVEQLRAATGTAHQMLVKVQILKFSLTKLRNSGIDLDFLAYERTNAAEARQSAGVDGLRTHTRKGSSDILNVVESLKKEHLANGLADSTLAVVSGRPVSMNVGGEFPVPVPAGNDSKTEVRFKEYGTGFDLKAIALGDNQVRLEIAMRDSKLDDDGAVVIDGVRVPGLKVRHCVNATELSFGETAVLTGLIEPRVEAELVDGKVRENVNEVGIMVVVTPQRAPASDGPAVSANRDTKGAIRK